jgi:hypothetical protein
MAPRLILLMSSGSKKEEPRWTCLCETIALHSQRMWAEVSSSAPHLLHSGLYDCPVRWKCVLRVLCPVRMPVTALDSVLLKDRNLALAPRQGPEISFRACLWVSPRPRHHTQCWLTNQSLILLRMFGHGEKSCPRRKWSCKAITLESVIEDPLSSSLSSSSSVELCSVQWSQKPTTNPSTGRDK